MANRSISELVAAELVTPTDLFVLEQSGKAKKLTGQTLENWLVSLADGHGGIQSIVKNSTSGLKDTYRITLADATTFDFIVTNGKSISSVNQTSTSGLERTYTIAFNDNTSQTFAVTDGRSITDITKIATNLLTDTYSIFYNDNTSNTFTVKNGRGINSFSKVSTVGLVDTYRIEYNDGTSDEFTVTNGAKGDPFRYEDFTDSQLSELMGKPATLKSSAIHYQASNSGTTIPTGTWSTTVPSVGQGQYLWTRTTTTFNTGNPVVSYSVSRMGRDGVGSVVSVAGVSPDTNGNIPLSASNVGLGNVPNVATNDQTPTYSQASTLTNLVSGEKLSVSMGKIMKAIADLISHIGNKSNPHGVTKSNVGLGNVDNVKQYSASNPPPYPVSSVNGKTGAVSLSASEVTGYKEWFGVGTAIPANADLNTYTTNGKYYCGNDSTAKTLLNAPTTSNFALFVFDRTGSGTVTHLAITLTGRMYLRGKSSSSWRDWMEFTRRSDISKDMMSGTEYTTLERYKGETVYAKLVSATYTSDIGASGAPIDYTIAHGISNLKEVIRWTGSDGTYTYPYFNANGGIITVKSVGATNIILRCIDAARAATADNPLTISFVLYYTKTS